MNNLLYLQKRHPSNNGWPYHQTSRVLVTQFFVTCLFVNIMSLKFSCKNYAPQFEPFRRLLRPGLLIFWFWLTNFDEINSTVCAAEVAETEINSHLDACLQSPPPANSSQTGTTKNGKTTNQFLDDDESSPCPVCGKEVLVQEMNDHLDFCVEANA